MKFVLKHLPGKVTFKEIDEMIETVDRNGDGKISFSEFRLNLKNIIIWNCFYLKGDDGRFSFDNH